MISVFVTCITYTYMYSWQTGAELGWSKGLKFHDYNNKEECGSSANLHSF